MTVYFIQAENGLIKIGRTDKLHLKRRFGTLRSLSPLPLTVLGIIPDAFSDKSFHLKFSHLRQHGEWFLPGNDLLSYIKDKTINFEPESPKKATVAERKMELFKELLPDFANAFPALVETSVESPVKETI